MQIPDVPELVFVWSDGGVNLLASKMTSIMCLNSVTSALSCDNALSEKGKQFSFTLLFLMLKLSVFALGFFVLLESFSPIWSRQHFEGLHILTNARPF